MKLFPWSNTPGVYATLEKIFLPRVCALRDRPYAVRYVRHGNARYRFDGAVKIRSEDTGGDDINQLVAMHWAELVSPHEERCAWCHAKGIVHCKGGCEAWVCMGRTRRVWRKGEYFHCRKSCGIESYLERGSDTTFYGSRSMPESPARPEQTMPRPQPAAPLNLVTSRIETRADRPALTTGNGNAKVKALPVPSRKLLK